MYSSLAKPTGRKVSENGGLIVLNPIRITATGTFNFFKHEKFSKAYAHVNGEKKALQSKGVSSISKDTKIFSLSGQFALSKG